MDVVVIVVHYTDDPGVLRSALTRLGRRTPRLPTLALVDAIGEAAGDLQRKHSARPVILVLTVGGEPVEVAGPGDFSATSARQAMADAALASLRESGASLHVLIVKNRPLGQVLANGPRDTGGTVEYFGDQGLTKIRETLLSQYALTYAVPDGTHKATHISLRTSRRGVKLIAPTSVPN